jgi:hypothetical protein
MASVLSHPAIALGLGPLFSSKGVGAFLFLCGASHGFFDAMTNGGLGVAFFAPLDSRRYFLTFRPLEVAFGRGVRFANRRPRDSSQTGLLGLFSRGSPVARRLRRR